MPLVYNQYLKQFIFYPTEVSLSDYNAGHQKPKVNENRNPSFYKSPNIPDLLQVDNVAVYQSSKQRIDYLAVFLTVSGWIGILIYFFHHFINFSLIGLGFYLAIEGFIFGVVSCFIYNYKGDVQDLLWADLEGRGIFIRELKRFFERHFPKLKFLFHEKYDYTKISLSFDFKKFSFRSKKNQSQSIFYKLASSQEAKYKFKYKDPRFQELLNKSQIFGKKASSKEMWQRLGIMFLFSIPSEDGLFLVPPSFLGINILTTIVFSLLFGFSHFGRYSAINCLRITLSTILIILFILPKYGLLTCIIGHVLYDLFFSIPDFQSMVRETKRQNSVFNSASGDTTRELNKLKQNY
ncbi:hypothetical protein FD723_12065 [Nostoc sp. C052]|uniref:hypothetical protein n=1 Tax=Nostoc sp. C052 TaxID=2576902 RepID=UPI0015C2E888|nr:hypothetical protein [Nostoc sp. C052]QLE41108.1 hypothetical protein FD723_12065 [Nostoc sp. C052]